MIKNFLQLILELLVEHYYCSMKIKMILHQLHLMMNLNYVDDLLLMINLVHLLLMVIHELMVEMYYILVDFEKMKNIHIKKNHVQELKVLFLK
jgi:hypothetical protein